MGPEGGHKGGLVLATGTPEEIADVPASATGQFLRRVLGYTGEPAGADAAVARAAKANGTPKAAAKPRTTRSRAKAAAV
jgi:excinuclease ABC subunit A